MIISSVIFYILSIWGLTHILVSSKILSPFRDWIMIRSQFIGDLFNCYQCTSFWVSIILYFIFPGIDLQTSGMYILNTRISFDFIMWGFIGSGLISFISVILSLIIKRTI